MIEQARENLAEFGDRVELIVGDLLDARARRSRSTRSSPTPPSTGSTTTSGCSGAFRGPAPRRRARGAMRGQGQRRRDRPRASSRCRATSASPTTSAACPRRPTSPRSGTRATGSSGPGSRSARPPCGSSVAPSTPPDAARVRPHGRSREAPRAASRGPARRVRRCRARLDAAPAGARLRPPQHLGAPARLMGTTIALLPGDGIGPEIVAAARRVLDAVGDFTYEEQPGRRRLDRRPRDGAHRRGPRGVPRGRRGPARRRRRPEVGHHRPRRARAPSRGCSGCARASGCSPTCGR